MDPAVGEVSDDRQQATLVLAVEPLGGDVRAGPDWLVRRVTVEEITRLGGREVEEDGAAEGGLVVAVELGGKASA